MAGRVSWLEKVLKPDPDSIAVAFGKLEKFLAPEGDRAAARRAVEQFAAYRWNGSALTQEMVKNVSSTGVYLLSKDRWKPGEILAITLQREGPLDLDPARRITTQAKVMRCGQDGVGLSFLWAKDDPEARQWDSLMESLVEQTKPADMLALVRMVDAFAFLGRICSGGAQEIGEWVRTRASNHKILNAVSIALKARNILDPGSMRVSVNPEVAVRILEVGSGTEEDWLHGFWAGLLMTSISADGKDKSNLKFVELFSQLTSIPTRIFTVVCTRATKFLTEGGVVSARPQECDLNELASTVGSRAPQMKRDLLSLAALQLIERTAADAPAMLSTDHAYITPTSLALQLFALCNGHQNARDFYFESR